MLEFFIFFAVIYGVVFVTTKIIVKTKEKLSRKGKK